MPTPEARLATMLDHATAADPTGVLLYFHTPAEAEAFLAYYTRSACQGAPPQTGGGDAGERPSWEPGWVWDCCIDNNLYTAADVIELRRNVEAALRSSRLEGAEAMRETDARVADSFTCGGCGMDGKAGAAIRALPIPGKTDAG